MEVGMSETERERGRENNTAQLTLCSAWVRLSIVYSIESITRTSHYQINSKFIENSYFRNKFSKWTPLHFSRQSCNK